MANNYMDEEPVRLTGKYKKRRCEFCGTSLRSKEDGCYIKLMRRNDGDSYKMLQPSIRVCDSCGSLLWTKMDWMVGKLWKRS